MKQLISKICFLCLGTLMLAASPVQGDPVLAGLIDEALKNNPDIKASQARIEAVRLRIPQAGSLPDPMVMVGYQNEGFDHYTYGEELGAVDVFRHPTVLLPRQANAQRKNDNTRCRKPGSNA